MNVARQPLLCLGVAQIRQGSMTLGAGEGGGHLGAAGCFRVGIVVGRVGGRHGRGSPGPILSVAAGVAAGGRTNQHSGSPVRGTSLKECAFIILL